MSSLPLSSSPTAFVVEHCDIPLGMTLAEWRRSQSAPRRLSMRQRFAGRVRQLIAR